PRPPSAGRPPPRAPAAARPRGAPAGRGRPAGNPAGGRSSASWGRAWAGFPEGGRSSLPWDPRIPGSPPGMGYSTAAFRGEPMRRKLALLLLALVAPAGPAASTAVNLGAPALEPASTGGLAVLDRALAKLSTHKR